MKKIKSSDNHKGVAVVEVEPPITNRAAYLAANPEARRVHEEHIRAITGQHNEMVFGRLDKVLEAVRADATITLPVFEQMVDSSLPAKSVFRGLVNKAEKSRQTGESLLLWSETLPGKKLTRDFYEQHKHELVDAAGRTISFELCEWYIKSARSVDSHIDNILDAWKYRQPMLLALGIEDDAERPPGKPVTPPDPLANLNEIFNPAEISACWESFLKNPRYCPNGQIRDDWREMLKIQWQPAFDTVEQVKKALGI
jgi:hypothetical protein